MDKKVIFVPGYHDGGIDMLSDKHQMWFSWAKPRLEALGIEVIAEDYPDAYICKASEWLPFIEKLGADESTILVGHSTGSVAAMQYAEDHRILGSVLVGTYYTDLDDPEETASGYFDKPWQWDKIQKNQQWIIQFHSTDDPWISNEEAHTVHERLNSELHEFTSKGHFGVDRPYLEFPELVAAIQAKLEHHPS